MKRYTRSNIDFTRPWQFWYWKFADTVEVNKITIKCIFQIDEIMEHGNKCVALYTAHKVVLAVKDCNGIISTTSFLLHSSCKWCSTLVWSLIIFAYEHYCQHKVRRIMVANYRVKLKTIRWEDVTYKQDAQYVMEKIKWLLSLRYLFI